MKIRAGFVSNSSVSSFVCDVCGEAVSGQDLSLSDIGWFTCINEHTICDSCIMLDEKIDSDCDCGEVAEEHCPICMMVAFSSRDLASYLLKLTGITRESVFKEVKMANKKRKKLYDHEYVAYVISKQNISMENIANEIRSKFKTYSDFASYIALR